MLFGLTVQHTPDNFARESITGWEYTSGHQGRSSLGDGSMVSRCVFVGTFVLNEDVEDHLANISWHKCVFYYSRMATVSILGQVERSTTENIRAA